MKPELLIFLLSNHFSPPLQCDLTTLLYPAYKIYTEADTHMCYIEPPLSLSSIFPSPFTQHKEDLTDR